MPRVDFVTSPGWLTGDGSRERAGLLFGGVSRVVTTLGVLGFDPASRRMRIEATHPGVGVDTIRQNTGFELLAALTMHWGATVGQTNGRTAPPSAVPVVVTQWSAHEAG